MKTPQLSGVLLALALIVVRISVIQASIGACEPAAPLPCEATCESDCFGTCLTGKSIFDSRLFENRLIGKKSKSRVSFHGWLLTGITVNSHGATNDYGGSAYGYNNRPNRPGITDASGNSYVLMLEQPADWKVNQLWFGAKRELTDRPDWGFQADFVYGTDARYARNWGDGTLDAKWGSGDYFAAFTNLFFMYGTKDLYVRVGKFPGGFAYEGLAAPKEFFYSHANICYGRPFTVQGATVEWKPSDKWTFSAGWTTGVFNSFENPYDDSAFLGKATYHFTKDVALTYKVFYNDKGVRPGTSGGGIDCLNTLIFTWKINRKWFYMGEIAYTDNNYYALNGGKTTGDAWGVNNHLIYTLNDKIAIGLRGEFHHSRNSFFDLGAVTVGPDGIGGQGGDLWNMTLAVHYKINPKMTFRPEIRYDYADYANGYRPCVSGRCAQWNASARVPSGQSR